MFNITIPTKITEASRRFTSPEVRLRIAMRAKEEYVPQVPQHERGD